MYGLGGLQNVIDQASPDQSNLDLLVAIRDELKLTNIAYLALHLPPLTDLTPYIEVTYTQRWIDHYRMQNFVEIDPVLREPLKSILPTDWATLDRSNIKVRKMFTDAKEFGVGYQGLTIPIRGARGELAFFSVTMDVNDAEWHAFLRANMPTLQIVAHYYHERVLQKNNIKRVDVRLSPRETDVLRWAANGKSVLDTADILGLSPHTVQTYLEMSRAKLQALNTSHAVARAMSMSLIPPPG